MRTANTLREWCSNGGGSAYPDPMSGGGARRTELPPSGSLRRSAALFRAFRAEQSDPERFYGLLAADSARQVSEFADLAGRTVLDVGGGPGYFGDAFRSYGATYFAVDADLGELSAREAPGPGTVLGSALALPVRAGSVDVCYSSNVLEHVARPDAMAAEMVRVTRQGGTVMLSFTTWLSPWGGHETSPWHYLGGHRAARRYERRTGRAPKNQYGDSLFAVSAGHMLRWAKQRQDTEIIAVLPRYHPTWARWLVTVPGLREVAVWNLLVVLRKR
jgi:SAM-dependent methyltransferase